MTAFDKKTCGEVSSSGTKEVWIYGREKTVRESLEYITECFKEAEYWFYKDGEWITFDQ